MIIQVGRWRVENYARTPRGDVPLDQLTPAERQALIRNIYLSFARALAPEGVEVRNVRLVPRVAAAKSDKTAAGG